MTSAHVTVAAAALAALSSALAAGAACAQDMRTGQPTPYIYGNVGFTDQRVANAGLVTGQVRLGARINNWFGLEGEVGAGFNRDSLHRGESVSISHQEAVYGMAFLPLTPAFDLFGRAGFGHTQWSYAGPAPGRANDTSYNIGAGGQWFLDPYNGLRAEYTMEGFAHAQNADEWAISYVRKF
jgi:hypothetical protein